MKNLFTLLFIMVFIGGNAYTQCTATSVKSGTTFSNDASAGTLAWSNPGNAAADDGSVSSVVAIATLSTTNSNYLIAKNFSLGVPSTASVCGVKVEIERSYAGIGIGSKVTDNVVKLIGGTLSSENKANTTTGWPSSAAYQAYGGSLDQWDLSLTPADVNSSDFGVAISVRLASGLSLLPTGKIDHIRITAYYNQVLPIKLENFTATALKDRIRLNWSTASETKNSHFIAERSADGNRWSAIDTIAGAGESYTTRSYTAYDLHPLSTASYRLRQIDQDGHSSTSASVIVNFESGAKAGLRVINNISSKTVTLITDEEIADVKLLSVSGQPIQTSFSVREAYQRVFYTGDLKPGLYVVRVTTRNGRILAGEVGVW